MIHKKRAAIMWSSTVQNRYQPTRRELIGAAATWEGKEDGEQWGTVKTFFSYIFT